MKRYHAWAIALGLVTAIGSFGSIAVAQPDVRDHRKPKEHRGPREAPPPPQAENPAPKPGFTWIGGTWEWKTDKYEWTAGHWERERAGKHWNGGHWDKKGDDYAWTEGGWADGGPQSPTMTTPPPVTDKPPEHGPGPTVRDHRHEWKLERPVVSSYWPLKGKAGTKIVIRGRNFPTDAQIVWGGAVVTGAKVTPMEIVLPAGAASGAIAVRFGGRDTVIGPFEVADFDAAAAAAKRDAEAKAAAEAAWKTRQSQLAKDKAARQAEIQKRHDEMQANRDQRRNDRLAAIRAKWDTAFLADADTQAELTLHAQRTAQLVRMREVAELNASANLVVRIGVAESKETDRHEARMAALKASFGGAK